MKKIITLICLVGMMQNGFGKMFFQGSYTNYTQNISATCSIPQNCTNVNIVANYGDSVVFSAYILDMTSGLNYYYPSQWFLEGDTIPNATGEFLTVIINQPGTYFANFISFGFGVGINFYVTNVTGIPTIKNINFLNVFPTTVTSNITIQLNSIKTNDVEISFFDMNGRELKTDFYKNVFGEFIKNENTEALAKGIYFLRIKTGEDVVEKKFVKM